MANRIDDDTASYSLRLPRPLYERMKEEAAAQDLSASQFIRRLLRMHFARTDNDNTRTETPQ